MTGIELFCGKGIISKTFREAGHEIISIDNRKRKGICEPTLRKDIFRVQRKDIPFERVNFLWAAVPCTGFSYGAGNYYFDKRNPRANALYFIKLLKKTLRLIELFKPDFFFLENPRGKLRYEKAMIDFLIKHKGVIKQTAMSCYGFPTIKPTDIFTNATDFEVRETFSYGKGAKNPGKSFNELTLCSRQETPVELARDVLRYMELKTRSTLKVETPRSLKVETQFTNENRAENLTGT